MNTKNDSKTDTQSSDATAQTKNEIGLAPELAELVMELREAVRRIDPRKHTPKTLRRSLSVVGDILADIDRLTTGKA